MDGQNESPELQRARGSLSFHCSGDKIKKLYQSGSAKLMLPKTYGEMKEVVLLNTSGGITGGDQFDVTMEAEDCAILATTQTAERLYRSNTKPAKINIMLKATKGATFHWLPQETIVFDGAEVDRTIRLDMTLDSTCLLAETIILGRQAMGEEIKDCHFTDQWRLYRDGKLFHAEALRITGDVKEQIAATAGGNNARLLSTIIYAGKDAEEKKGVIRPWLEKASSCTAASCWDDRLVIRILSPHAQSGRSDINHLLQVIRNQPLPRVWQT